MNRRGFFKVVAGAVLALTGLRPKRDPLDVIAQGVANQHLRMRDSHAEFVRRLAEPATYFKGVPVYSDAQIADDYWLRQRMRETIHILDADGKKL